jgi:hypothetical protein
VPGSVGRESRSSESEASRRESTVEAGPLWRAVGCPTQRVGGSGDGVHGLRRRWDFRKGIGREGTGDSVPVNRRCNVIILCPILDQVVDAAGSEDGFLIDLLANAALWVLLCNVLDAASVQAISRSLACVVARGSAGIPGENHSMVAGLRRPLQWSTL